MGVQSVSNFSQKKGKGEAMEHTAAYNCTHPPDSSRASHTYIDTGL